MSNLFQSAGLETSAPTPLAEALRPATLEDVVGQDHLIGAEGPIGRMLAQYDFMGTAWCWKDNDRATSCR